MAWGIETFLSTERMEMSNRWIILLPKRDEIVKYKMSQLRSDGSVSVSFSAFYLLPILLLLWLMLISCAYQCLDGPFHFKSTSLSVGASTGRFFSRHHISPSRSQYCQILCGMIQSGAHEHDRAALDTLSWAHIYFWKIFLPHLTTRYPQCYLMLSLMFDLFLSLLWW